MLHSPHDVRNPFEEGRFIAATIPGAKLEPFDSPNHTPLPGEPAYAHVQRSIVDFVHAGDSTAGRPALHVVAAPDDDATTAKTVGAG